MIDRRSEILNGELSFPKQIMELLKPTAMEKEIIADFWDNLWHNFLREKLCDTITWYEVFPNSELFNQLFFHLSKAGWINSIVDNNYAQVELNESKLLKWVSKEELIHVKFMFKFLKYRLKKTKSVLNDTVQLNGKHIPTGLKRNGFMKAGNSTFKYDTKYIQKYLNEIAFNLKKGLEGSTKDVTYQEIIEELVNYYSVDGTDYTLGNCIIDSRGRSIFQCSKKIFNPVSSKDARALLVVPSQRLTTSAFKAVYAAIAELLGYRGKNYKDKVDYGQAMYIIRQLPSLEDMKDAKNYDDLHSRIWLERIYENLNNYEQKGWYVPIELDALASQIQLVAVLTNDHTYMDGTNLIGEEFKDIWTVDYCSRTHVKKALTPKLYGSSRNPRELWDKNHLKYTQQQVNEITKDLAIGKYANANRFKDFIIDNVQPQTKMTVHIWDEVFQIECNRFKWEETTQVEYTIYATQQSKLKRVVRTVNLVPDCNQFKRYFQTLLLHNLDSQIANYICENMDWVLPNHDAFTVHPNDANRVRELYVEKITQIYKHRKDILRNYLDSIGIKKTYEDKDTEEVEEFLPYCLK